MEKISAYDETNDTATRVGKYIGTGIAILAFSMVGWLMLITLLR